MKSRKNNVFGLDYNLNAPENLDEAIAICGGDEALLLEHFIQKLVYNHHNADVRSSFCEALEEQTGVKRLTSVKDSGKKNEDGTPKTVEVYAETETEYVNRVASEQGAEVSDYAELLQSVADKHPLDGKKRARSSAGPRLAKMYIEAAQGIVDAGAAEKAAAMLSSELGEEIEASLLGIAGALKEREDRKRAEFAKSLKAFIA